MPDLDKFQCNNERNCSKFKETRQIALTRCICSKRLFLSIGVGGAGLPTTGARWFQKWVVFEKLHQKMCPKIEKYKI